MKAARLINYGETDSVVITEVEKPTVGPDNILIEVHAAGVNPIEWKVQLGYMKDFMPLQLPITLGGDVAGIVTEVGENVTDFKPGDAVFGQGSVLAGASGTFAEYNLTVAKSIAKKPELVSFEDAGSASLTGVSAIQALYEHLTLQPDQTILIQGGTGGIGSVAIQIAKHIGAKVITTASTDSADFAKNMGADEVIDYKTQKFEEIVKDVDAVFDTVGGETTTRSYQVLKKGGKLVSMVTPPDEALMKQYEVEAMYQGTKVTTEKLQKLGSLIADGVITVHIAKTFALDETAKALDYLRTQAPNGKVVIKVK